MKMKLAGVLVIGASLLGVGSTAEANLITNGSFEADVNLGIFQTVTASSTPQIPGWTITAGSVDWIQDYWKASDGSKSLDLAGLFEHGAILSYQFSTVVGQTYLVEFDMAGNPDKSYAKALLGASVGGVSHQFTFSQAGNTHSNMGWELKSFSFLATGTTSRLTFEDVTLGSNPEAWGAALDNVRVNAVPEPGTMLLLGSGLLGLAAIRRRRKL